MRLLLVLWAAAMLAACGISEDRVPRRIDVTPDEIGPDVGELQAGILGS